MGKVFGYCRKHVAWRCFACQQFLPFGVRDHLKVGPLGEAGRIYEKCSKHLALQYALGTGAADSCSPMLADAVLNNMADDFLKHMGRLNPDDHMRSFEEFLSDPVQ